MVPSLQCGCFVSVTGPGLRHCNLARSAFNIRGVQKLHFIKIAFYNRNLPCLYSCLENHCYLCIRKEGMVLLPPLGVSCTIRAFPRSGMLHTFVVPLKEAPVCSTSQIAMTMSKVVCQPMSVSLQLHCHSVRRHLAEQHCCSWHA